MAATLAAQNVDRQIEAGSGGWEFNGLLTLSGSYAAGGDAPTPTLASIFAQNGAGIVDYVAPINVGGYVIRYDRTTAKFMVYQGDNPNAAQAPGSELPAAAYPAALTATSHAVFAKGR